VIYLIIHKNNFLSFSNRVLVSFSVFELSPSYYWVKIHIYVKEVILLDKPILVLAISKSEVDLIPFFIPCGVPKHTNFKNFEK